MGRGIGDKRVLFIVVCKKRLTRVKVEHLGLGIEGVRGAE